MIAVSGKARASGVAGSRGAASAKSAARGAVGQRHRQKQATRLALRVAALRLFAQDGFHETTVEAISAAAGVSKRTFFLHFSSKDEVLLGHVAEQLDLLRASLASAAPNPHVFIRAGNAVTSLAREMQARDDLLLELDLLHRVPALLAVSLEQFTGFEDAIADAVRGWLHEAGIHPHPTREDDAFAQLVGTVSIAALRCGLILWRHEGGQGSLARLVAEQFDAVGDGLRSPAAPLVAIPGDRQLVDPVDQHVTSHAHVLKGDSQAQ
jgi:AcrR family transcriptional regulator